MTIRVGINGFGRMGRLALRAGWGAPGLDFVHVNEIHGGPEAAAHLLTFDSIHGRFEVRVAKGRYGRDRVGAPEADGRLSLWIRPKRAVEVDPALLAVIADQLPNAVGNALGMNAGGTSLDNSLRILRLVPTSWILADIQVDGVESGVAHGAMRLFAETGELMAVASQSLVLRVRSVPGGPD